MPENIEDVDLTVPGAIERLMAEDVSDEESEDLPEDDSKRNAAFAKLRKQNKLLSLAQAQFQEKMKASSNASANGQGQPNTQNVLTPNLTNEQQQALRYSQMVESRAKEMTDKLVHSGMTQEVYTRLYWMNAQSVLTADLIEKSKRDSLAEKAPTVVNSVLSEFGQLSDEDRTAIRGRLKGFDPVAVADPQTVKREVFAFLGEKSLEGDPTRKVDKKPKSSKPSGDEEEGSWRDTPPDRIGAGQQSLGVGAAAASEAKEGRGMKIPHKDQKAEADSDGSRLTKDDRETMRHTGLDPADPVHVKRYKFGQKTKASSHIFG